ncbi:TlpA family protein disulfide reductase [Flavitalea antarctica]
MKIITRFSFIYLSVLCACAGDTGKKQDVVIPQSKFIDSVYLTDLKGDRIDLRDFKGKVIFLNFWATWCRPCLQEMPSIDRASKVFAKNEVVFILASSEGSDEIIAFKDRSKYDFNFAVIGNGEDIGIKALPTTMIFDVDGNLHFSEAGSREWDDPKSLEIIKNLIP